MQNEVKFSRYAETGKYVSDVDLEEFVMLYVNHRPAFGISKQDLCKVFQLLGVPDEKNGKPVITREELLELLQARGRASDIPYDCIITARLSCWVLLVIFLW